MRTSAVSVLLQVVALAFAPAVAQPSASTFLAFVQRRLGDPASSGLFHERLGDSAGSGAFHERFGNSATSGVFHERLSNSDAAGVFHERLGDAASSGVLHERLGDSAGSGAFHKSFAGSAGFGVFHEIANKDADATTVAGDMADFFTHHVDSADANGETCDFECAGAGIVAYFTSAAMCATSTKEAGEALACITLGCPMLVALVTEACLVHNPSCQDKHTDSIGIASLNSIGQAGSKRVAAALTDEGIDFGRLGAVLKIASGSSKLRTELAPLFTGFGQNGSELYV